MTPTNIHDDYVDLFESKAETADANGEAIITLQPLQAFKRWYVRRMTVHSSSTALVPKVLVYRGAITTTRLVDGTFTGTLDHSDTNLRLGNTDALIFHFTNADVGANCVATIEGEIE